MAAPVLACPTYVPLDLDSIDEADAVIVGRVIWYEIAVDPVEREREEAWLAKPWMAGLSNRTSSDPPLGSYARITFWVERTLAGTVPRTITIAGGARGIRLKGRYLIGLRNPRRNEGPSSQLYTVLSPDMCSGSFIFASESPVANHIREKFGVAPVLIHQPDPSNPSIPWHQKFIYVWAIGGFLLIALLTLWAIVKRRPK